jgi:hypothetical protein
LETKVFDKVLDEYRSASIEEKIDMYCSLQDLTEDQYMVLLKNFPMNQLSKLEKALA